MAALQTAERARLGARRMLRRTGRFLARAFLPPRPFPGAGEEAEFLADYARRFATHRRAALALAVLVWTSFFAWDIFHIRLNPAFQPYEREILGLRGIGLVTLLATARALRMDVLTNERKASALLAFGGLSAYVLLVAMLFILPFPDNYMFYFIGLLEVLLFIFGLLRLRARWVIGTSLVCLVLTVVTLTQTSNNGTLSSAAIATYYPLAAITYLVSFVVVGVVIAGELERTARATFVRERRIREFGRALASSNADLIEAQRLTDMRTSALMAAKDEMRALAEQQNRDKSRFLASAAHDLRQPMQALSNLLEASSLSFARGEVERGRELLAMGREAAQLTRSTFNSVLDISRLESGFVEADLTNFDCAEVLAEVAGGLAAQAEMAGVTIRLRLPERAAAVRSDRHMLGRVLANLVGNAIKYADPAKGPRRAVVVGAVPFASRVRIDVVDNGIGIDPASWAEIFRPFVQLHNPERDRSKGIGLGLSIVQASLALLPGHRLDMTSQPGAGTRFSIELPLALGPVVGSSAGSGTESVAESSWRGAYVLYVEDDPLVRQSTEQVLAAHDIHFESFSSLADLKAGIERFEMPPDLILTDYRLPDDRTADDVVIMAEAWFELSLPVVVLTGEVSLAPREGWQVLHKPVATARLLEAIGIARTTPRQEPE